MQRGLAGLVEGRERKNTYGSWEALGDSRKVRHLPLETGPGQSAPTPDPHVAGGRHDERQLGG